MSPPGNRELRPSMLVPPPPVLDEFQKQVEPLYRRIVSNLHESRTLAELRDVLLPKLLSGELRVSSDNGRDKPK